MATEHLERAIGVVYRPQTERESHYFYSSLPKQFDEYIWLDETQGVRALQPATRALPGADCPFSW